MGKMKRVHTNRMSYKKELKVLAGDFFLLDRPEVQEAIVNSQNYEDGRRKIMKVYEMAYMG